MTVHARLAAIVLVLFSSSAEAEWVTTPYTQFAIDMNAKLEEVSTTLQLNPNDAFSVKRNAAYWIHVGPCRGSADDVAKGDLSIMINPLPKVPYHAAMLEMVAIMSSTNLGREPAAEICQFAKDMAK